MSKFSILINRKMTEYQARVGRRVTVTEFAELIGCYQGDLSHWLKGRREPGLAVIRKLADNPLIGLEIWEATGYIVPMPDDPLLVSVINAMRDLPPELREHYAAEIHQAAMQNRRTQTAGFQFSPTS